MKFFPGQEKFREFCGWPGKFRKDWESQRKVREFENKWLWKTVFRKFIYSVLGFFKHLKENTNLQTWASLIVFKRGKNELSEGMEN